MPVAELFRALGDPTRLQMVQRLSRNSDHTIGSISSGLKITRQGARKHIQILVNAKLVTLHTKGRDTFVQLDKQKLDQGKKFIASLERRWDNHLENLREFVDGK